MNTVFFFNPDSSNICVLRKYICSQSFVRFWQRKPIHTLTYLEDRTALRIFPILYYLGIYLFVVWCCFHSKSELKSWNRTQLYPFCPVDRFMYNEFWTSSLKQSMWYLYIFENFSCIIYYFKKWFEDKTSAWTELNSPSCLIDKFIQRIKENPKVIWRTMLVRQHLWTVNRIMDQENFWIWSRMDLNSV